jgi:hypothetical protein
MKQNKYGCAVFFLTKKKQSFACSHHRANPEAFLKELAETNVTHLAAKLFRLPRETSQTSSSVFLIPTPTTILPREKPVRACCTHSPNIFLNLT